MQDTRAVTSILFHVAANHFLSSKGDQIAELQDISTLLVTGGLKVGILFESGSADTVAASRIQFDRSLFPSQVVWQTAQLSSLRVSLRLAVHRLAPAGSPLAIVCSSSCAEYVRPACAGCNCRLLVLDAECPSEDDGLWEGIRSLGSLPEYVVRSHEAASGALVAGYTMKPSRVADLAGRGFFPLIPSEGVCFLPLNLGASLEGQGKFDIILHKGTDELEGMGSDGSPSFSSSFNELLAYADRHPDVCIVDPLGKLKMAMDRNLMASVLTGLSGSALPTGGIMPSAPASMQISGYNPEVFSSLTRAGLKLPLIVKPLVACGVSQAHHMALVLSEDGFLGLQVSLPATVQQYIDHGGLVYKVYVIGQEVHVVQRASSPDLTNLTGLLRLGVTDSAIPRALEFDSLKTLPASLLALRDKVQQVQGELQVPGSLDPDMAKSMAECLRERLGLHLFGFDVIQEQSTGRYYIIDVNFFPSFKEVPAAAKLVHRALREAFLEHQMQG